MAPAFLAALGSLSLAALAAAHVRGNARPSLAAKGPGGQSWKRGEAEGHEFDEDEGHEGHPSDVEANLELAREWMSVGAPNASHVMLVAMQDAPLYYDCGLAMNTAWGAMARSPCGLSTWTASDKMKEMALNCSKLQYGEKYIASYRALKHDQDTWCGPPSCDPACMKGVKCFRSGAFPFEPTCEFYPSTTTPLTKSAAPANQGSMWLAGLFMMGVCRIRASSWDLL